MVDKECGTCGSLAIVNGELLCDREMNWPRLLLIPSGHSCQYSFDSLTQTCCNNIAHKSSTLTVIIHHTRPVQMQNPLLSTSCSWSKTRNLDTQKTLFHNLVSSSFTQDPFNFPPPFPSILSIFSLHTQYKLLSSYT